MTEAPTGTPTEASSAPPESPGTLGIWALVLALVGLLGIVPVVGSVLGLILGRVAVRQAGTRPMRGGRGLAVAAVVISIVTLVVLALAIAAYALVVAYLDV